MTSLKKRLPTVATKAITHATYANVRCRTTCSWKVLIIVKVQRRTAKVVNFRHVTFLLSL